MCTDPFPWARHRTEASTPHYLIYSASKPYEMSIRSSPFCRVKLWLERRDPTKVRQLVSVYGLNSILWELLWENLSLPPPPAMTQGSQEGWETWQGMDLGSIYRMSRLGMECGGLRGITQPLFSSALSMDGSHEDGAGLRRQGPEPGCLGSSTDDLGNFRQWLNFPASQLTPLQTGSSSSTYFAVLLFLTVGWYKSSHQHKISTNTCKLLLHLDLMKINVRGEMQGQIQGLWKEKGVQQHLMNVQGQQGPMKVRESPQNCGQSTCAGMQALHRWGPWPHKRKKWTRSDGGVETSHGRQEFIKDHTKGWVTLTEH